MMLGLTRKPSGIKFKDQGSKIKEENDISLEELKKRDLVQYLSNQGIQFKKNGNGWVALCPLHEETNPSFHVSQKEGVWLWHCFGCNEGGSVIDYVKIKEGIDVATAIERLRNVQSLTFKVQGKKQLEAGGSKLEAKAKTKTTENQSLVLSSSSVQHHTSSSLKVLHQKLLEKVCEYYTHTFHEDLRARNYLSEIRGITDPKLYEIFRIGYCNGTIFKTVSDEGENAEGLKELGIISATNREFFEGCVVFPLLDEEGRVVSFYGRRIQEEFKSSKVQSSKGGDESSKFKVQGEKQLEVRCWKLEAKAKTQTTENKSLPLSSSSLQPPASSSHLYLKGPHRGLFNGPVLKLYPEIILTESIIDSLSLYQAGFKNTIPLYGLNGLTSDHLLGFKRNNTSQIILLMDGDEAGRNGSPRLKERLEELGTPARVTTLSDNEDPNSYLKKHTAQELEKILYPEIREGNLTSSNVQGFKGSRKEIEDGFSLRFATRTYELRGIEQTSSRHLKANIKAISNHRFHIDTIDLYNSRARQYLTREIAIFYSIEADLIEQDMEKLIVECQEFLKRDKGQGTRVKTINEQEESEALQLARDPKLTERIIHDLETLGLIGEDANKLLLYLSMSSRKMSDPLSVLILSGSGAGKSVLQDKVLSLCPEEDLIKLTSLTKQALFYKDALSMVHKVLAIEEEKGAEDASYPIRSLISSKKIVIESTIRDPHTGRMTTMTNEVLGPTAVIKSTTQPKQDQETKSRFMTLSMDESQDQTEKILESQRDSETLEGLLKKNDEDQIKKNHQNFQRLLQPIEVVIPKELELSWRMKALMARRDHPKYLALIKAAAFIHQHQRPVKEIEHNGKFIKVIEVEKEDLKLTDKLAERLLTQNLNELSEPGQTLLNHLQKMKESKIIEGKPSGKILFTRKEIREALQWTDYQVRTYLRELVELEYVITLGGRQGSLIRYKLL